MKRDNTVEQFDVGRVKVRIEIDDDPTSPREWDNMGIMACWHRRYNLGDVQPKCDPREYLKELVSPEYHREAERLDARLSKVWSWSGGYAGTRSGYSGAETAIEKRLEKLLDANIAANVVILPLFLYDHSGITMRTGSFGDPWDSGQVGIIHCSLEKAQSEFVDADKAQGWAAPVKWEGDTTRTLREAIIANLEQEVKTYDEFLTSQVYGFVVEDEDGEHLDSCWGFYGLDYCRGEARGHAEYQSEEIIKAEKADAELEALLEHETAIAEVWP